MTQQKLPPSPPPLKTKTLVELEIEVQMARNSFGIGQPLEKTELFTQKDPRWLASLAGGDQCA